jgi:hypothetical protein
MLNNPEVILDKFECNHIVANWLIYKKHLPLLGLKNQVYYFAKTDELKKAMKEMPIYVKMMEWL